MHFEQWKKASSTLTTITNSGLRLRMAIESRSSTSLTMLAVPLTRNVSVFPGIKNISPTFGFCKIFHRIRTMIPGSIGNYQCLTVQNFDKAL